MNMMLFSSVIDIDCLAPYSTRLSSLCNEYVIMFIYEYNRPNINI